MSFIGVGYLHALKIIILDKSGLNMPFYIRVPI